MFFFVIFDAIITVWIIVSKGISNHLMKTSSKRRRTKQEIKEQKVEEERKQNEIERKLASYDAMQFQMNQMQE